MERTNSARSRAAGSRLGRGGVTAGLLIAACAIALACLCLPGCEGCEKILNQVANKVCPLCDGKGKVTCPQCNGHPRDVTKNNGNPCRLCSGTGKLVCPACDGSGKLINEPARGK